MKALFGIVIALCVSTNALAQDMSAQAAFIRSGKLIERSLADEQKLCERPLTNTPAKCREEFAAFRKAWLETATRHVMYLLAKEGSISDDIGELKKRLDQAAAVSQPLAKRLDRLYVPKQVGQAN